MAIADPTKRDAVESLSGISSRGFIIPPSTLYYNKGYSATIIRRSDNVELDTINFTPKLEILENMDDNNECTCSD